MSFKITKDVGLNFLEKTITSVVENSDNLLSIEGYKEAEKIVPVDSEEPEERIIIRDTATSLIIIYPNFLETLE